MHSHCWKNMQSLNEVAFKYINCFSLKEVTCNNMSQQSMHIGTNKLDHSDIMMQLCPSSRKWTSHKSPLRNSVQWTRLIESMNRMLTLLRKRQSSYSNMENVTVSSLCQWFIHMLNAASNILKWYFRTRENLDNKSNFHWWGGWGKGLYSVKWWKVLDYLIWRREDKCDYIIKVRLTEL